MIAMTGEIAHLLGLFVDVTANAFDFLRRLAARDAHDFHQLGRHLRGHLILNAAFAVGIGFEKPQNLFFGHAGFFQTVEKLTVADFAAQLVATRPKSFLQSAQTLPKSPARSPQ